MSKFRKKPVVIEAVQIPTDYQIGGGNRSSQFWERDLLAFIEYGRLAGTPVLPMPDDIVIQTLEHKPGEGFHASPGDWLIRGVKGEVYACKPDIFAATYEPVGPVSPVRDPAPPSDAELLAVFEAAFDAKMLHETAPGDVHEANMAGIRAVRGVRDPSPPELGEEATSAAYRKISRALAAFDWTIGPSGRHTGTAFVKQEDYDALLAGIDELRRGVRGAGVVPPDAAIAALEGPALARFVAQVITASKSASDVGLKVRSAIREVLGVVPSAPPDNPKENV